jgi:hypothetical protein
MANVSKINGFRPIKHVTGAPYNGQANMYAVASGDSTALFVGDVVKLAADGNAAGIQYVTAHAAGTAGTGQPALGVVVGVINTKQDPVEGRMTGGSIALDTPVYRVASTEGYVLVADAPDVIYEVEATAAGSAYSFAVADVGTHANLYAGAGSTVTGNSQHSLNMSDKGTTSTLPFKIVGVSKKIDNEVTGNYTKVLVQINNHQYKSVGTVGV